MNEANPTQEQNPTPQPVARNSAIDNTSSAQEETPLEKHPGKQEIDLNELFPDAETDLNNLFPDAKVKHLLKSIIKNKKDMGSIEERLATENETPAKNKKGKITADNSPQTR